MPIIDRRYTTLLAHFNETSGTAWVESSPWNLATLATGSTVASVVQTKFGGASRFFPNPNTNSWISLNIYNPTLDRFYTEDFTISAWVYPTVNDATYNTIISRGYKPSDGWFFGINQSMDLYFDFYQNPASTISGGTVALNTWSHCAVCRKDGTTRLFLNGAVVGEASQALEETITTTSTNHFTRIGRDRGTSTNYFRGYIDEVLIQRGEALYWDEFTPPTEAYSFSEYGYLNLTALDAYEPIPYASYYRDMSYGNIQDAAIPIRMRVFNDNYYIEGTLSAKSAPVVRIISLYQELELNTSIIGNTDRPTLVFVQEMETIGGIWRFDGLDPLCRYTVIANDRVGVYDPIIRSALIPKKEL